MNKHCPSSSCNLAFVALFGAMVTVAAFRAVPKPGTNLLQGVFSPLPTLPLGNPTNDDSGDVAKFFVIEWKTNGVDLVLHRPEAVAVAQDVSVGQAGQAGLVGQIGQT